LGGGNPILRILLTDSGDGELWHFGGTVGSLEHCFTAVSRGWNDSDHGFEEFFKSAWRSLSSEEIK
jgi:hypothetical protein